MTSSSNTTAPRMSSAFANHLQLFGLSLSDADSSLVTCIRELYDNSLDATDGASAAGRVDVCVQLLDASHVRVTVADNGHGFNDAALAKVTQLFASTKGHSRSDSNLHDMKAGDLGSQSAGVYGVGLKAVLLWSAMTASPHQQGILIQTATMDSDHMTKMAVHLAGDADEAGAAESGGLSLRAVDSRVTIPKQGARYSGTAITCILGGSANALAQLRASFDAGRALLRPSPLHLSIRLADAPTIDMHVAQTDVWALYQSAQTSSFPALDGVRAYLAARADGRLASAATAARSWLHGFGEGVAILGANCTVHVTALIAASDASNADETSSKSGKNPISLRTNALLFLNNKRVGEDQQASMLLSTRCASVAGLRKIRWRQHGCGLHASRLEAAFDSNAVKGLWFAIHVRSSPDPQVAFGDLAKSYVVASKGLVKTIGIAADAALGHAVSSIGSQGVLLSKRERQREEDRMLAHSIANSIASIVCNTPDKEITRKSFQMLGLQDDEGTAASSSADPSTTARPPSADASRRRIAKVEPALLQELLKDWDVLFKEPVKAPPAAPKPRGRKGKKAKAVEEEQEAAVAEDEAVEMEQPEQPEAVVATGGEEAGVMDERALDPSVSFTAASAEETAEDEAWLRGGFEDDLW